MTSTATLQANLAAAGHVPGPVDGILGGRTFSALLDYAADRRVEPALGPAMAHELPRAEIDTPQRTVHFLAQALHETGGCRYLTELGGPVYFARYDGRADLGNTEHGDGARFCGRGIFQLTGRANYERFGDMLGVDLIANPMMAAEPEIAVRAAALYWRDRGLNHWADLDDIHEITRRINGGLNGLADRMAYLTRLKAVWGLT